MGDCPDLSKTGFLSTDVTMSKIPQSPTASLREIYVASILSATATTKHLFFFFSNHRKHKNSQNLPFDYSPPPLPPHRSPSIFMAWENSLYPKSNHVHSIPSLPAPYLIPSAFQIPAFKPRISTPPSPIEKNFPTKEFLHHRKPLPSRPSPTRECHAP